MAGSIAATTRSAGAGDRIDLCWRDDVFAISHVGGDGSARTRARIGALGSVTPESPDTLGGTFTTVPAAALTFAQRRFVGPTVPPPIHRGPVRTPTPAPRAGLRGRGEAVGVAPDAVSGARAARSGARADALPIRAHAVRRGAVVKRPQITRLCPYRLGAAVPAVCAALVLLTAQPAAATVRAARARPGSGQPGASGDSSGQPGLGGGNFPSLAAIEPGRHPAVHLSTPVNIVFVGYRSDTVNVGRILSQLPSGADPRVRSDVWGCPR